jgi:hypothetical protein
MAILFSIKQNDTYPYLAAQLKESKEGGEKELIDLTSAEKVKFVAKLKTGETVIEGECTIVEAKEGKVEYEWASEDTKTAGLYEIEFKITWAPDKVQSVPNEDYDEIEIEASL